MFHDTGRHVEPTFEEEIRNGLLKVKDLGVVIPALMGREFQEEFSNFPPLLQQRILYDIWSNFRPITEHRTADIVHQCDREAILGPAVIGRGVAFDVVVANRDIPIAIEDALAQRLPTPESAQDTNWLIQYEFFGRNVYPATTPEGKKAEFRNKVDNAAILMLSLHNKSPEHWDQVFGPERGLYTDELHWTKKKMSEGVYSEALQEQQAFLTKLPDLNLVCPTSQAGIIEFTRKALMVDKVVIPKNFDEAFGKKLSECSDVDLNNYWMIMVFALLKRHTYRKNDLIWYQKACRVDKSWTFQTASRWVIDELMSREEKFTQEFPEIMAS